MAIKPIGTIDFIEKIKEIHSIDSNAALASRIKVSKSVFSGLKDDSGLSFQTLTKLAQEFRDVNFDSFLRKKDEKMVFSTFKSLVVEDTEVDGKAIVKSFRNMNFEAELFLQENMPLDANSARMSMLLDKFEKGNYDLISFDQNLGNYSFGSSIVKHIKKMFPNTDCCFICITGNHVNSLPAFLEAGGHFVYQKPHSVRKIVSDIKYFYNRLHYAG